jgi:16S rRNA (guanine527-N7)-methyltransferase
MTARPTGSIKRIRNASEFAAAFHVSRETTAKLEAYAALLREWQKAVSLVAPTTLRDLWHRHFADSAQLLQLAPEARIWLDLGSGGGFPGLVIALLLANRDDGLVHLIEANSRKCAFLAAVIARTGAPALVHEGRIEAIAKSGRIGAVDVIAARALAPLDLLLELAYGFFASSTIGLLLKGREAEAEIAAASRRWQFVAECLPSRTSAEGRIVAVKHLRLAEGKSGERTGSASGAHGPRDRESKRRRR